MNQTTPQRAIYSLLGALVLPLLGHAAAPNAATDLLARHAELLPVLEHNAYGRPLFLDSTETSHSTQGDAYVVVNHPYSVVVEALSSSAHWCDILILHVNTKYCRPAQSAGDTVLQVGIGRKFEQAMDDVYRVDFVYRLLNKDPKLLQVGLDAAKGPMGTRDYRILLQAVPLDNQRSFLHLSYAYGYGVSARFAMQTYLATLGRSKLGFTVIDHVQGEPVYVEGVRGAVERNTIRYSLAIEAYLGAYGSAPAEQVEKRLHDWYAATERHALQLHEMDEATYLAMKRNEIARQQSPLGTD